VDVVFWAALGFLVLAIFVGAAFVAVRAWRAWQACISLALVGAAGAELLATRGDRVAVKAERAVARLDELQAAAARLERSTGRARVLLDAVQEPVAAVRAILGLLPTA
jgi:hypothetical protein